jgi:hypothetical protein
MLLLSEDITEADGSKQLETREIESGDDLEKEIERRSAEKKIDPDGKTEPGLVIIPEDDFSPGADVELEVEILVTLQVIIKEKKIGAEMEIIISLRRPPDRAVEGRRPAQPGFPCQARGFEEDESDAGPSGLSGR